MNLEIVVFVGIALAKLPKLCKIQQQYMPKLAMDCELLRFRTQEQNTEMELYFAGAHIAMM